MSAAVAPPPFPADSPVSPPRKPLPATASLPEAKPASARSAGTGSSMADGRHIADLDREFRRRVASLSGASISKLIQAADVAYRMSEEYLNVRNRRDEAYIEYAVAYDVAFAQCKSSRDYPTMLARRTGQNWRMLSLVQAKLTARRDQYRNIRTAIEQENKKNHVQPCGSTSTLHPAAPSQLSRPQSALFDAHLLKSANAPSSLPSIDHAAHSSTVAATPGGILPDPTGINLPRPRPAIQPKPESLHVKTLSERLAALRVKPAGSASPDAADRPVSTDAILMPVVSDFLPPLAPQPQQPPYLSKASSSSSRLVGPRPMQIASVIADASSALSHKLVVDNGLAAPMPRPPSPTYSPARNMQTPASINPPRTSARSIVGTGGKAAHRISATAARPSRQDEIMSHFPPKHSLANQDSKRKAVVGFTGEKSITAPQLFDFIRLYSILLVDVRSRARFDDGHIEHLTIICVEPFSLRPGTSALDIESSLAISPDNEEAMFKARDEYDFIVYYDQSTPTTAFLQSTTSPAEQTLRTLYDALVDYNYEKPLRNPPMLLAGGTDAWVRLLGQAALSTSSTQAGRPSRRRVSSLSGLPSSLVSGRRRLREWNPLNPDEERQWAEQARTESIIVPAVPDEDEDDSDKRSSSADSNQDAQMYRTHADFLRRYPAVPVQQESMMMPPSRPDSRATALPLITSSKPCTSYEVRSAMHEMPSRPAPAAPRVSYSGAHDRNALQPLNAVRARSLAPYTSWHQKPCNVRIPHTGLANFGTTCYMNSVIQCLSATIPLTICFQDVSYKKWLQRDNWKGSRGLLSEHYANLVSNLWLDDAAVCRPVTFRRFCARLNPDWGSDRHQDANDFYVFLMDYLHEDLNIYWRNPPPHVLSKEEEESRENSAMYLAASIEWDRWSKREKSLISDLFAGQHASRLRCLSCGTKSTTYEPWFNLSIELPASGPVRLEDCLASYTREEQLARGEEWFCPKCQTTRDATKKITLTKAPLYMVVHFKRFHNDTGGTSHKVSTVVDFPLSNLDLAPYMLVPPSPEDIASLPSRTFDASITGPFKYNAYAVVEHYGKGLQFGHYIAWIHDRPRAVWRRFDDSSVSDVSVIRPAGAYLVFYERVLG